MEQPVPERENAAQARRALLCLASSMLLSSLGISIANVALPVLANAFSADFPTVQWVVIAYLLAITATIVGVGRLGDVAGHRRVLLAGIFLFALASALCGAAPTLWLLIASRAVQGVGAAIMMALTVALVRKAVPAGQTGRAMGLLGSMSAIGTALGPSLGGVLITGFGWRAIFAVLVPLALVTLALAWRYLPRDVLQTGEEARRPDGPGPLVFRMFCHRTLRASLAMNALVAAVMMATLVVGPFYLSGALGLNAAGVGFVMSVGPVISSFSGIPAGRIVDGFGASVMLLAGLVAMAAGSLGLALLPHGFGLVGYVAAIAVLTPGYQLFLAANNTAVMMDAGADQLGTVSGLLSLSRNLGLVAGASAMGAVFSLGAGTGDVTTAPPDAVAYGLRLTFLVAAGLMVVALALAFGRRSRT